MHPGDERPLSQSGPAEAPQPVPSLGQEGMRVTGGSGGTVAAPPQARAASEARSAAPAEESQPPSCGIFIRPGLSEIDAGLRKRRFSSPGSSTDEANRRWR
jgi:hypothetical protein